LVPHKRVELALAAVERLRAEFPELRLVVAGRGWWEPHLRQQVVERGLDDVVDLAGFVSDQERHRLYASSWILLMPSLKEGWGLVVLEAGLHQTPSIAFHGAGGVAESVHDGHTGLLAREDDQDHFVELIRSLLSRHHRRRELGRNAAEFAGYFTWEQTAKSFAQVLDGLLSGPSAKAPRRVAGDRAQGQRFAP
jgi:glycosyltransferase involved in cell wall biosynthesis